MSLAPLLKGGELISLTGDLGAGKTQFTKALAEGLGIKANITSPTFTLIKEYKNERGPDLYHFDTYRLASFNDMYYLGYEEYFYGSGVTVVEWGDKVADLMPADYLEIKLERGRKMGERLITIDAHGERFTKLTADWLASYGDMRC